MPKHFPNTGHTKKGMDLHAFSEGITPTNGGLLHILKKGKVHSTFPNPRRGLHLWESLQCEPDVCTFHISTCIKKKRNRIFHIKVGCHINKKARNRQKETERIYFFSLAERSIQRGIFLWQREGFFWEDASIKQNFSEGNRWKEFSCGTLEESKGLQAETSYHLSHQERIFSFIAQVSFPYNIFI